MNIVGAVSHDSISQIGPTNNDDVDGDGGGGDNGWWQIKPISHVLIYIYMHILIISPNHPILSTFPPFLIIYFAFTPSMFIGLI